MYWLIILVIVFILGVKLGSTLVCGDLVFNKRITLEEYNLYKSFKKLWELFKRL